MNSADLRIKGQQLLAQRRQLHAAQLTSEPRRVRVDAHANTPRGSGRQMAAVNLLRKIGTPTRFDQLRDVFLHQPELYQYILARLTLPHIASVIRAQQAAYERKIDRSLSNARTLFDSPQPAAENQTRIEENRSDSDLIEVHGPLSGAVNLEGLTSTFRYWLIGRHLDTRGCGRIEKRQLFEQCKQRFHIGKRGIQKAIAADVDNVFFRPTKDRHHIYLRSFAFVLAYFDVKADRQPAYVPAAKVVNLTQFKQLILCLAQARLSQQQMIVNGEEVQIGRSITRAQLRAYTGIDERTQRDMDRASNTRREAHYTLAAATADNKLKFGHAIFKMIDDGRTLIVRRGNIYHPASLQRIHNRKRAKRLNSAANSVATYGTPRTCQHSETTAPAREKYSRYEIKQAVRAAESGQSIYLEHTDVRRPRHHWSLYLTARDNM